MDQLKAMKSFICIAEQKSLSKAAELLNSSPSSIARLLASLEEKLGIRLINRTTRSLALTDDGAEYLEWCKHILTEIELMDNSLEVRKNSISGELKISAPIEFGNIYIAPLVNEYLKKYPAISIQLNLSDKVEDIVQSNLDLAIRIGHLPDSSLIASRIGYTKLVYCASSEFLDLNINSPLDLENQRRIVVSSLRYNWVFIEKNDSIVINSKPILFTDQISVARQACIDGLGIGCFYYYQVVNAIQAKKLFLVLNHYNTDLIPINCVYPHVKHVSPRIKHFITWFKEKISSYSFHD